MKAVLKFLLNTGAGQMIVKELIAALIRLVRRKVETLEPYKKDNLNKALDLVHDELHAGNISPKDLLRNV